MAKITYGDKTYNSKSDLITELFNLGKLTNNILSIQQLSKELNITTQTIQLTLNKITETNSNKITEVNPKGKVSEIVVIRANEETSNKGKQIKITYAPNKWGLPITNPPIYVIDKNYKENEFIPNEDSTNAMSELITY